MKPNEIKKHEEADIAVVLNRLADLLEQTLRVFEETRQKALDNHNYFKGLNANPPNAKIIPPHLRFTAVFLSSTQ